MVNDVPVRDDTVRVSHADLTAQGYVKLSAGKKRHVLIRPV